MHSTTDSTRSHTHEIILPASAEAVFDLLITPSAICKWWEAARAIVLPEPDGTWAAAWGPDEDDPDFITVARMSVFDPPRRIVFTDYRYLAKAGPLPFDADFTTEFTIEPRDDGAILRVRQDGFPADPAADDFYAACEKGWHDTFANIERFVEARRRE